MHPFIACGCVRDNKSLFPLAECGKSLKRSPLKSSSENYSVATWFPLLHQDEYVFFNGFVNMLEELLKYLLKS
jgi:hypothetical protein